MNEFTIISLIVSILSLLLSVLLWFTTIRSLKQAVRQNEISIKVNQSDSMKNIVDSHRDLFFTIIKEDCLAKIVSNSMPVEKFREKMIGTILINHCNTIHLYAQKALIDDDDWLGLQNDIKDFFTWPAVKDRWPEIRSFYSQDFQRYIDNLTVLGRMDIAIKQKL